MTPQEKADELIEKFAGLFHGKEFQDQLANQAAIICVEEILKQHDKIIPSCIDINGQINPRWTFWQQVLTHLKK